jgi:hypothetical protein
LVRVNSEVKNELFNPATESTIGTKRLVTAGSVPVVLKLASAEVARLPAASFDLTR